jgi:hypothetical protein
LIQSNKITEFINKFQQPKIFCVMGISSNRIDGIFDENEFDIKHALALQIASSSLASVLL